MTILEEDTEFLEHYGVSGMKWGVRRGSSGARPIAVALNKSKFGQMSKNNVKRHASKQITKGNKKADKKLGKAKKLESTIPMQRKSSADAKAIVRKKSKGKKTTNSMIDGFDKGVDKREAKAKRLRRESGKLRRGATKNTQILKDYGDQKLG